MPNSVELSSNGAMQTRNVLTLTKRSQSEHAHLETNVGQIRALARVSESGTRSLGNFDLSSSVILLDVDCNGQKQIHTYRKKMKDFVGVCFLCAPSTLVCFLWDQDALPPSLLRIDFDMT